MKIYKRMRKPQSESTMMVFINNDFEFLEMLSFGEILLLFQAKRNTGKKKGGFLS